MINFEQALVYLQRKKVTAQQIANDTGHSKGTLHSVLTGATKKPRQNTQDIIVSYAEKLMKEYKETIENGEIRSTDKNILLKDDEEYIIRLAVEVRKNKDALLEVQMFKDLIYIEALKILLQAKEGDSINIKKLESLHS